MPTMIIRIKCGNEEFLLINKRVKQLNRNAGAQ